MLLFWIAVVGVIVEDVIFRVVKHDKGEYKIYQSVNQKHTATLNQAFILLNQGSCQG